MSSTQEETDLQHPEFYEIGYRLVGSFWSRYSQDFLNASIDHKDLKQEAAIAVFITLQKYDVPGNEHDLKSLTLQAVYWRLKRILRNSYRYNEFHTKIVVRSEESDEFLSSPETYFAPILSEEPDFNERDLIWTELRKKLLPNELQILQWYLTDKMTFEDIGQRLKKTGESVRLKYNSLLRTKIYHYLKKQRKNLQE